MKRKHQPVSQQENRDRHKRAYRKLDRFIDDWYDGEHQEIEHSEISEMERKLRRLTPALQEIKRDAPVIKRQQEASQDYSARSHQGDQENMRASSHNMPLNGGSWLVASPATMPSGVAQYTNYWSMSGGAGAGGSALDTWCTQQLNDARDKATQQITQANSMIRHRALGKAQAASAVARQGVYDAAGTSANDAISPYS